MDSFDIIEKFRDDIRTQLEKEFEKKDEKHQELLTLISLCGDLRLATPRQIDDDEWKFYDHLNSIVFKGSLSECVKYLRGL